MQRLLLIFGLLGVVVVVGCKPLSRSELCGHYLADYKFAIEKVVVNCDGSFEQEVTLKSTRVKSVGRGSWTYDSAEGYIVFDGTFFVVQDGAGNFNPQYAVPRPAIVSFPVDRPSGTTRFGVAEGIIYIKQR